MITRECCCTTCCMQPINYVLTLRKLEIVLRQPRARSHYMPLPLDGVDRVASAKLLGVIFQENFKMDLHVNFDPLSDVNFVLSQCNQRLYLLKLLRSQGLCLPYI